MSPQTTGTSTKHLVSWLSTTLCTRTAPYLLESLHSYYKVSSFCDGHRILYACERTKVYTVQVQYNKLGAVNLVLFSGSWLNHDN